MIAGHYHDKLQQADRPIYDDPHCQTARMKVLGEIPPDQTFNGPEFPLHSLITNNQVTKVLLASKNGTTTGLDGIPYEIWKMLHSLHMNSIKLRRPSFNVIKCLRIVYNEIQTHRIDPTSHFSDRWMCPIYKKKDKTKIENYRPITLLNTDYKIMMKTLVMQLTLQACTLLHPYQTGFVPMRSIFNPIRLAETMCEYANYMEENGAIVALDQEKAYDKIDHKYLLKTLKAFCLPNLFTKTVDSLYHHVTTQ